MNIKRFEWTKKEYLKLAETVNAFECETVQIKIVERLLPIIARDYNIQIGTNAQLMVDNHTRDEVMTS